MNHFFQLKWKSIACFAKPVLPTKHLIMKPNFILYFETLYFVVTQHIMFNKFFLFRKNLSPDG